MTIPFEELYGSKNLLAEDITKPVTDTITSIDTETFGRNGEPTQTKAVLTFKNLKKKLVLNKTNAARIAHTYGKNSDNWIGKSVTIVSEVVPFGGKLVPALRLYPVVNAETAPPKPPSAPTSAPVSSASTEVTFDDEVPF